MDKPLSHTPAKKPRIGNASGHDSTETCEQEHSPTRHLTAPSRAKLTSLVAPTLNAPSHVSLTPGLLNATTHVTLTPTPGPSKGRVVKRRYDPAYISFGFTYTGKETEPIPQCVICLETLSNGSMKPSHLLRHFKTKHPSLQNVSAEFFRLKELELKASRGEITYFSAFNDKLVEASFKASLKIALVGKSHTIGEKLVLPAAKDIVSSVLGESAAKQLDAVSLSDKTVSRRISSMAHDVKMQVIEKVKCSKYFALQFDESTDVADFAQLMCFVRFEDGETFCEEFAFCEPLTMDTTSANIILKINDFINTNGFDWGKCAGVCTDGTSPLTGKLSDVATKIKEVAPQARLTHCCIHREHLVAKNLSPTLKTVLDEVVNVVNFIKSRSYRSRLFSVLCDEMGSEHEKLLFHTEARWLSRGNVLCRIFELRHEVKIFLAEFKSDFGLEDRFGDELWLCRVAYLADIFSLLNNLNKSLQGNNTTPFLVQDKVKAMKRKLQFVDIEAKKGNVPFFSLLQGFVQDNELQLNPDVLQDIRNHCSKLIEDLNVYFLENLDSHDWIRDPFSEQDTLPAGLTDREIEQFIELSCDTGLKNIFLKLPLSDFWFKARYAYPEVADRAIRFLVPFSTTYVCEQGFSTLVFIKNKYRNRPYVEDSLRLKLSKTQPNIEELVSKMKAQTSHS